MSELKPTQIQLDKEKLQIAVEAIFEGLNKYKIPELYAAAALSLALDFLKEQGVDIVSVKLKQFREHN